MFDPTAYENIKVIMEGLVYEYDLKGDISVIERNDLVNLADLSRTYNMSFVKAGDFRKVILGKMELTASHTQMAAEWNHTDEKPGAKLSVHFYIFKDLNEILEKRIIKHLKQTFYPGFTYDQYKITGMKGNSYYHMKLEMAEMINEITMSDLPKITEQMMNSLEKIYNMLHLA